MAYPTDLNIFQLYDDVEAAFTELGLNPGVKLETITTAETVVKADNNTIYLCNAVDLKITLPDVTTVDAGFRVTAICKAVSATTGVQLSPAATDAIHYITSVDDKDVINTAATDVEGDMITLVSDGSEGWWVLAVKGTWAKEA